MKKAIVLLSGGLDSATCLSVALKDGCDVYDGYEVYTLSFDYGQRHNKELECAKDISRYYNLKEHKIIRIDYVGGSALTDRNIAVPDFSASNEIPVTYVPARNIVFLSFAAGYAEVVGAEKIYTGVNAIDYSGYPDCRPEFINAFEKVAAVGTKAGVEGKPVKIETPLIKLSKAEIIKLAYNNGVPIQLTTSCYRGGEKACGRCDSCTLRLKGFEEAGLKDPIEYMQH